MHHSVLLRVYYSSGEKEKDSATFTWRSDAKFDFVKESINSHSLNLCKSIDSSFDCFSLKYPEDLSKDISINDVYDGKVKKIAVVLPSKSSSSSQTISNLLIPPLQNIGPNLEKQRVPGTAGVNQMKYMNLMLNNKQQKKKSCDLIIEWEEVKKHNKENDCWVVLNGKVYDVTTYLNYHPGGKKIIAACAGTDITSNFYKYHPWVNADLILNNSLLGKIETFDSSLDIIRE